MQKLICSFILALAFSGICLGQALNQAEIESLVSQNLWSEQGATAPKLAKLGQWPVGVSTISVRNPQQISTKDFTSQHDRSLKVEVWYPAKIGKSSPFATYQDETRSGKPFTIQAHARRGAKLASQKSGFPLIVMSHGYTGYRTMMYYLAEHLASHGYVVASIDHTDSTNADVVYNRARDQQFVLDALSQRASGGEFAGIINANSAAIVGYSMGGYGAINTVGGCYSFSTEFLTGLGFPKESLGKLLPLFNSCSAAREKTDARWKALITFAPWGGEQQVHSPESLQNITTPALFVAGDHDDVSGYDDGVKKLYQQLGSKDKYLLVYQNARHNIAAHPAPKVAFENDLDIGHYYEPSWNSETIAQINKHMVLAFLDCHVKSQKDACTYLPRRQHATQTKQADGSLTKPWPGFTDRWALGMQFFRGNISAPSAPH